MCICVYTHINQVDFGFTFYCYPSFILSFSTCLVLLVVCPCPIWMLVKNNNLLIIYFFKRANALVYHRERKPHERHHKSLKKLSESLIYWY